MRHLNPPEVDKSARRTRHIHPPYVVAGKNGVQAADKYGKSGIKVLKVKLCVKKIWPKFYLTEHIDIVRN